MQHCVRILAARPLHTLLLLTLAPMVFAEAVPAEKLPSAEELEKSRIVCKYERPIGSLIKVKRCRTKGSIAETTAASQKKLREIQDGSVRTLPMGVKPPTDG